jgi:hypothetical protein
MGTGTPAAEDQICLLQINSADNVAVAVQALQAGHKENIGGAMLVVLQNVNLGAKLALRDIAVGEKIIKFGEPIGSASEAILAGEYVHTHNLQSDYIPTAGHDR